MDVLALLAAVPVAEEAASAHAFLVGDEVQRGGAVGLALLLDCDDGLAGWDGVGGVWLADAVDVGLLGSRLSRHKATVDGTIKDRGGADSSREGG